MGESPQLQYWTCYVDMDGVVADFMSSVIEVVYGATAVAPMLRGWPKGVWDTHEAIGQSEEKVWAAIKSDGIAFWRDLKLYPWARALVTELAVQGDVVFLSSPSRDPMSAAGKTMWVAEHFPEKARDLILAPSDHKWRLANERSILIDDKPENCADWESHGGHSIIFPMPWNDASAPPDNERAAATTRVVEVIKNKFGKDDTNAG